MILTPEITLRGYTYAEPYTAALQQGREMI